jgi:hypothetical protein
MSCVCLCSGLVLFSHSLTLSFSLSVEPVSLFFYKSPDDRAVCGWKQTNQLETSPTEREGRQVTEEEATLNDTTTDERIQEADVVCIYSRNRSAQDIRRREEEFPFISFRYLLLYSFIIKRDLLKRNRKKKEENAVCVCCAYESDGWDYLTGK